MMQRAGHRLTLMVVLMILSAGFLCGGCAPEATVQEKPVQRTAVAVEFDATPLHRAARLGETEKVATLLTGGADPRAVDGEGWTALHWAASVGHAEVAKELVERAPASAVGSTVSSADRFGRTPLHLAAAGGHTDIVQLLIAHGADVDATAVEDLTPLHLACCFGRDRTVAALVQAGAAVNAQDQFGQTPLALAEFTAAEPGCSRTAAVLAPAGAVGTPRSEAKPEPTRRLHEAFTRQVGAGGAATGDAFAREVERLLAEGADPNGTSPYGGELPLTRASELGNADVVRLLIDAGADVNLKNALQTTALHIAAEKGFADVVALLLEREADPNVTDAVRRTPLLCAIQEKHTECVKLLLEHGADPNPRGYAAGLTPLEMMLNRGAPDMEIAWLLVEHGGRVANTPSFQGDLRFAVMDREVEMAKLLLRAGVDPNIGDTMGTSLLLNALRGNREIAIALVEAGADVNVQTSNGLTPLHMVAQATDDGAARLFLEHGAEPNARRQVDGRTPLHLAAGAGRVRIAQALLEHGADVNARADDGQTPLAMAKAGGHAQVTELLRRRGGTE